MKAAILILGEDGLLSHARAQMLKGCWETLTAKSVDAQVALHERAYDLLLFSQTVPDGAIDELMASTTNQNPDARFLVTSEDGRERPFGCATFTAEFFNPDRLRRKVVKVLDGE